MKHSERVRALDVGAGVGRVTSDTLLPLVHDVVLLEPVGQFVQEALRRAQANAASTSAPAPTSNAPDRSFWPGLADQSKSVTVLQGTLQDFDPLNPHRVTFLDRVGYQPPRPVDDIGLGFDIIWCQWCLGHLSDEDLVAFFIRCRAALKQHRRSMIVVKENLCQDLLGPKPLTVFDDQDSSLTRSVFWGSMEAGHTNEAIDLTLLGRLCSHKQVSKSFGSKSRKDSQMVCMLSRCTCFARPSIISTHRLVLRYALR